MRKFGITLVAALVLTGACGERKVPVAPDESESLINDPVAQVARSIAMALGDAAPRKSLAEALRASPYVEQKLEFARFRATSAGDAMLRAAASVTPLNELPALELYLPIAEQRAEWNGSPDVWVLGTSLNDSKVKRLGLSHLPAFDVRGEVHWVSMREVPSATLISLVPVESRFDLAAGPSGLAASASEAAVALQPGWVMDELQMGQQPWAYDDVPFGHPEFEVWFARFLGNGNFGTPLDAQSQRPCASEEWVSSSPKYFNYDNPPNLHTYDFNFAFGSRAQLNAIYGSGTVGGYLFITENDDTACPNSAEPSTDEFDNTDWGNDDEVLGIFSLPASASSSGDVFQWINPNEHSDPVYWRVYFVPAPPPPPPPPPPPLSVTLSGPSIITQKGTYTYTVTTTGFSGPSYSWQSRFCDDAAATACNPWQTTTGLTTTLNRTLSPDCSTQEKNFQVRVTVTNYNGESLTAEKTTQLCQYL